MLDQLGYKELVVHPPPFNFFILPLTFLAISKKAMKKTAPYFSKMMFWFENMPMIAAFFFYEFILLPVIYFK